MKLSLFTKYIFVLALCLFVYHLPSAFSQGFTSITPLDPIPMDVGSGTQDKSQSKVFIHDGKHWAVLANQTDINGNNGTGLYRLDGTSWTFIINVSGQQGRADCKIIGDVAHIFLFRNGNSQLVSLQYNPIDQTFSFWDSRPGQVVFSFGGQVETATIDIDGTGKMWIAYERENQVKVRWSIPPYSVWSEQIVLGNTQAGDVATLIAMPGKIGVMWSDQNTQRFGFRTHLDEDPPDVWSSDEVPASQSALNIGAGMADDHMNLAVSSTGVVYAAVKHGYNNSSYPLISLLVRQPNGIWDDSYTVSNSGTTPIALLNEAQGKIKVVFSSQTGNGEILYSESSTTGISFGSAQTLIGGANLYRDPTGLKSTYNPDVVVLANHQAGGEAVGVLGSDEAAPAPPSAPSLISPAHAAQDVIANTIFNWNAAESATKYWLQVSTSETFSTLTVNQDNLNTTTFQYNTLANETQYFWRVQASNITGFSDWSEIRSFTTEEEPPTAPGVTTLNLPSNDAINVALNSTLEWLPTFEADSYDIQVSTDNAGNFLVVNETGITSTSYQLSNFAYGTEYFWRVRAINNVGPGDWSVSRVFTTVNAPLPPGEAPGLISPSNATNNLPLSLGLEWGAVNGAENYNLQVDNNTDFDDPVSDQTTSSTSAQLSGLENEVTYYWRVQGQNEAGPGPWSQIWSFSTEDAPIQIPDVPELLSPDHQTSGVSLNPHLEWEEDENADYYGVQVSLTTDFTEPFKQETHHTQSSYSLSNLAFGTEYFWRVRARNSAGDSEWSEVRSFTTLTEADILAAHFKMDEGGGTFLTDHSTNANHAPTSGNPSWAPGIHGLAIGLNGNKQYGTAPDHPALDITGTITVAAWIKPEKNSIQYILKKMELSNTDGYEFTLVNNNKILFRFNQLSSGNTYQLYSEGTYPTDGSTWIHVAATFDGSTIRMYINGVQNSSKAVPTTNITANGLPLTIGAGTAGAYSMQGALDDVRIYSTALGAAAIQELAEFTPTPAGVALLSSPEDNATEVSKIPDLAWDHAEAAASYRLQVSPEPGFNSPAFDQADITATSVSVSGLGFGTQYFWRVLASNPFGDSGWSEVRSFTTLTEAAALAAHFKMDEGGGTFLTDHSTNANHAPTSGNPSWAPGIHGLAIGLNGNKQYGTAPDHPALDITGTITVAAWIKPEKNSIQYILKKMELSNTDGYEFTLVNNNKILFRFNQLSSGNTYQLYSEGTYPTDGSTWIHVAATFDGSTIRMYINGVQNSSKAVPTTNITANGLPLTIGAGTAGAYSMQGALDDVRIYSTALGAAAIQELAEFTPTPAGVALLSSPEDNATEVSKIPDLAWDHAEAAASYRLQVSPEPGFNSPAFDQADITATSVSVSGLGFGTQYFWRVLASNPFGDSGWSEVRSFTTLTEAAALAAHFKMDEGGGTFLTDHSTNANHAPTSGNPSWAPGIHGLAIGLNGNKQYGTAPDHPALDITGTITVAAWIKPEKNSIQYILKKMELSNTDGYEFTLVNNNKILFRFNQLSSGNTYQLYSEGTYPTDGSTWIHVAATFDGSTIRMYINGVQNSSKAVPTTNITANGLPLTIGAGTAGAYSMQGALDDVRIYSTALGAAAIQELAEFTPTPAGVALLSSPEDNATEVSKIPDLAWDHAEAAASYRLQVSPEPGFNSPAFDQADITATSVSVSGLGFGTQYFWRVLASNPFGDSGWSEVRSFTTLTEAAALAAHFKMDEGGGTFLTDHSTNANHAPTSGNPSWAPGIHGLAIGLNGNKQYGTAPDHPALDITGTITVAAWIKPEKNSIQYILKKMELSNTDGYEFTLVNNNKILFRFNQLSSGNTYQLYSEGTYPTDGSTWIHVAATFDGSTIRMYINGVQNSSKAVPTTNITANGLPLTIGAGTAGAYSMQGALDDVRIYSTALGAAAIQELATLPLDAFPNARLSFPADKRTTGEKSKNTLADPHTLNKNLEIKLFPNPVDNEINLEFVGERPEMVHVLIYDQLGRTYLQKEAALETGNLVINQLEKTLKPGVYFLRVQSTGISKNFKILKK